MTSQPLSLQGQIQCVRREIALRKSVYPGLVSRRSMKQGAADYEIAAMEQVLKTLLWIERHLPAVEAAIESQAAERRAEAARRAQWGGHPG